MITVKLFHASWCGPCSVQENNLKQLQSEFPDFKFVYLDVDKDEDEVTKYSINTVPTTIIESDDKVLDTYYGPKPIDEQRNTLNYYKTITK